jgi:hypothetical protein
MMTHLKLPTDPNILPKITDMEEKEEFWMEHKIHKKL